MGGNEFGRREIPNAALRPKDAPLDTTDLASVFEFALTYDGYSYHGDDCGEIANAASRLYFEQGALPGSLDELRTCLLFEQRRWHHFGYSPDAEALRYFAAMLGGIRGAILSAGESPRHT